MLSNHLTLKKIILSAMFLSLALVLPFLTGQIPSLGNALLPMHIPILLCGYFCGGWYAAVIGLMAPLLRFLIFAMPPLIPKGIAMCGELATYGLMAGWLYRILPKRKWSLYLSLISAMIAGRIVWGCIRVIFYGLGKAPFGWAAFLSGAVLQAVPGIIIQLLLIPIIVMVGQKLQK